MNRTILAAVLCTLAPAFAWAQGPGAFEQSGLVGKLEGPTLLTDAAQIPKTFREAPALAALVQSGALPPVAQRVPAEPMVIKPLRSTGSMAGPGGAGSSGRATARTGTGCGLATS